MNPTCRACQWCCADRNLGCFLCDQDPGGEEIAVAPDAPACPHFAPREVAR